MSEIKCPVRMGYEEIIGVNDDSFFFVVDANNVSIAIFKVRTYGKGRAEQLAHLIASALNNAEKMREALKYATIGVKYPHNRFEHLIQDKILNSPNHDDKNYWRYVLDKFEAVLASLESKPEVE